MYRLVNVPFEVSLKTVPSSDAAMKRCSIEGPVGGLNQSGVGNLAVGAAGLGAKAVKRGQRASGRNLEERALVAFPAVPC